MARILQHPLPVRRAGGSLGQPPRPSWSAGSRSSPSQLPLLGSPCLLLPAEALPHATATASPGRWGLGPVRRLAAVGWPSVIGGEAGTSVCSFCGRHCPPGGTEDCVSLIHGQTVCLASSLAGPSVPNCLSLLASPQKESPWVRLFRDAGGIEGADPPLLRKRSRVGEADKWLQGRGLRPALWGKERY